MLHLGKIRATAATSEMRWPLLLFRYIPNMSQFLLLAIFLFVFPCLLHFYLYICNPKSQHTKTPDKSHKRENCTFMAGNPVLFNVLLCVL